MGHKGTTSAREELLSHYKLLRQSDSKPQNAAELVTAQLREHPLQWFVTQQQVEKV